MPDIASSPRVIVPFAFIQANTDNPGLKDFSPAVLPADAPEEDEDTGAVSGEARDDSDPKVNPSSAPASAPSSHPSSEAGANPENPEEPAPAEKVSPTTDKTPTE